MISVAEATARLLALAPAPTAEFVGLAEAGGRVLAADAVATAAQPPFDASSMDGYALRGAEVTVGARFRVVGEAAAGRPYRGAVAPGEAVRIFTGGAVPEGADRVVIQEDVTREGDTITLLPTLGPEHNIRPAGGDFAPGFSLAAGRRLGPAELALLAAMNIPRVAVARRPEVAVIATGDELVQPGEAPGAGQIVASNGYGLKAMIEAEGGRARLLPIARDTEAALQAVLGLAGGADLIVTIGGASVGDHDLVSRVAQDLGADMAFHKVAIRPGKPLMSGRLGNALLLGLPGNPVSALVCGKVFLQPLIRSMQGVSPPLPRPVMAALGVDLRPNGPRAHYMRATLTDGVVTPFENQDSSLLSVLAAADCLMIREAGEGPRKAGEPIPCLPL